MVDVVGLLGGRPVGPWAEEAIRRAVLVVGGRHQLDAVADLVAPGARTAVIGAGLAALDEVAAATGPSCVLASGDPGCFGILAPLTARIGGPRLAVHPAPSSVGLAFARLGLPWDHAMVASCHRGDAARAAAEVAGRDVAAVLCGPEAPPQAVGAALAILGATHRLVAVATRLGEPGETVTRCADVAALAAGRFDARSVVVLAHPAPEAGALGGRPVEVFAHRASMITKPEVRSVVLGKLSLPTRGVLWDVGAGSGSVAVEAALAAPGLKVIAVEHRPEDAARVLANAGDLGAIVEVVEGVAPGVLAGLPAPDRVFVGGGGLPVLDACLDALRPGGRVVATFAAIDRAVEAHRRLGSLVQVGVSQARQLPDGGLRLVADNPVFVAWGDRASEPPAAPAGRLAVGVGCSSTATPEEVRAVVEGALAAAAHGGGRSTFDGARSAGPAVDPGAAPSAGPQRGVAAVDPAAPPSAGPQRGVAAVDPGAAPSAGPQRGVAAVDPAAAPSAGPQRGVAAVDPAAAPSAGPQRGVAAVDPGAPPAEERGQAGAAGVLGARPSEEARRTHAADEPGAPGADEPRRAGPPGDPGAPTPGEAGRSDAAGEPGAPGADEPRRAGPAGDQGGPRPGEAGRTGAVGGPGALTVDQPRLAGAAGGSGVPEVGPPAGVAVDPATPPVGAPEVVTRRWDAPAGPTPVVATVDRRCRHPAVVAAADPWPVISFPAALLGIVDVPDPSDVVAAAVGTPSVAEAAALLAAGPGARLVVGKQRGTTATAAVAVGGRPPAAGRLQIVGLGPGHPRHRTPAAVTAVRGADAVLGYGPYVDAIQPLLSPDQLVLRSPMGAEAERATWALALARAGWQVALVSSGDPGVFAMASTALELAAETPGGAGAAAFTGAGAEFSGVACPEPSMDAGADHSGGSPPAPSASALDAMLDLCIEIVPGVTASSAAAAAAGAPLAGPHAVLTLSDLLLPWSAIEAQLRAAAASGLALALYNPRSAGRPDHLDRARTVLLEILDPATPVAVVTAASEDGEQVTQITLADLDPTLAGMRSLVLVGTADSLVTGNRLVTRRHHPRPSRAP